METSSKKDKKGGAAKNGSPEKKVAREQFDKIANKKDLKTFLASIRDRMADGSVSPVYGLSALNNLINTPTIYSLLDNENKELARDIWLRLKSAGIQIQNPPLLFSAEEGAALGTEE